MHQLSSEDIVEVIKWHYKVVLLNIAQTLKKYLFLILLNGTENTFKENKSCSLLSSVAPPSNKIRDLFRLVKNKQKKIYKSK